ncbi:E3 ubiquitin-protein ligase RING1-like [Hordeum vulgare]|nr:E3 ubiquitin-protein ligase RING1-like [Hordeum vulgare]
MRRLGWRTARGSRRRGAAVHASPTAEWAATAASPAVAAGAPSYWCYSCERFVRTEGDAGLACSGCDGGFLEQMDAPPPRRAIAPTAFPRRRAAADAPAEVRPRRGRRGGASGDRSGSPYNPVIVLRRAARRRRHRRHQQL